MTMARGRRRRRFAARRAPKVDAAVRLFRHAELQVQLEVVKFLDRHEVGAAVRVLQDAADGAPPFSRRPTGCHPSSDLPLKSVMAWPQAGLPVRRSDGARAPDHSASCLYRSSSSP